MKRFLQFVREDLDADLGAYQKRRDAAKSTPASTDTKWQSDLQNKINANMIRKDPPITKITKPEPVNTTGANSGFADPEVKAINYNVTPEKPLVGNNDAVKKALAAKGYDATGKKKAEPYQPKVGSLVAPQSGYPAAKKAPIPTAKPKDLIPKKQTFKQAFASAKEGSKFTYNGKTYLRKTKR